jgi:tetratricopeptide (TPR) repeat protein
MSPEQALAQRVVIDQRSDIYSLGVTLYELMTLQPAFDGKDRQELLKQIAFEEPRAPQRLNKSIPPELQIILHKAMEKNPGDRYPTAQEMADDLRHFLHNEPIRARRPTPFQRVRKIARRHPGVTVTVALALAIGLVLGVAGLAVNYRMVRWEQLQTKAALGQAEQEKAIAQAVTGFLNKLLAQADPRKSANKKSNPTIRELLNGAADELSPDKIDKQFPDQPLVQAGILKAIGEAYNGIGEYASAMSHLVRARDLQIQELGPDHADTLATMNSIGRSCLGAGNAAEAASQFELVRDRRMETLGPIHRDTLESMNDLYRAYFKLKLYDQALQLRKDMVKLRTDKLGPDHPDTLASMNNLANSYASVHRLADALELHQKTLVLRQTVLGADHPDTLDSMNNVANCLTGLGRHAEALRQHEETLAARRTRLGEDDPATLVSMNNVAYLYGVLGRHAEAIKLHEQTLKGRTAKLGLDHPDTLYTMNALAWMLATCPETNLRNPSWAVELSSKAIELAPAKRTTRTRSAWPVIARAIGRELSRH